MLCIADGLAAFTTNYNEPSWLASQYFIWTSSIGYEVIYPNGAYLYNLVDRWIKGTVPNEAESCLQTIKENESPRKSTRFYNVFIILTIL